MGCHVEIRYWATALGCLIIPLPKNLLWYLSTKILSRMGWAKGWSNQPSALSYFLPLGSHCFLKEFPAKRLRGLRKKKKKSAFHQIFFEAVYPTDFISLRILFSPLARNVCPQRHYAGLKGSALTGDNRQRFKLTTLQQLNQFSGISSFSWPLPSL